MLIAVVYIPASVPIILKGVQTWEVSGLRRHNKSSFLLISLL